MEYVKLGSTGMDVSRLCLGCMTFGEPDRGTHPWTLDETQSRGIIRAAIESGINFFDTANVYSLGSSEEILGRALGEFARREEVIIATKVAGTMHDGPNGSGLSRKAIFAEIDNSLRRLGTDYVDLYQIHRLDPLTPVEETLEALNDVVRAGKARYIGASSMPSWKFARMLDLSQANGWARFITMQNHLNLLYREEEREMVPLCRDLGIGLMPWSPLARGRLAHPWKMPSDRQRSDEYGSLLYDNSEAADRKVVDRLVDTADKLGQPMAVVALAWLLNRYPAATPIVGINRPERLKDSVASLSLTLDAEILAALEEPYAPHAVAGH